MSLIKIILTFATPAVIATIAHAQLPPEAGYACRPYDGCQAERQATHDIGKGTMLTLPPGWTYYSYPLAPIPGFADLRQVRAFKDGMLMVITPFPNIDERPISEDWIKDKLENGSALTYVAASREQAIQLKSMTRGELVGAYAAFTSAVPGERPFRVVPNRRHAAITTFLFSHRFVIFTISLASEREPDEEFSAASDAVRAIQGSLVRRP